MGAPRGGSYPHGRGAPSRGPPLVIPGSGGRPWVSSTGMSTDAHPPILRRIVVSVVVIVAAFVGGHVLLKKLAALRKEPERSAHGQTLPVVRAESLARGDHRETLRGYGVARPLRQARVSAEVGGIVREVSEDLEVGNWVEPPAPATTGPGSDGPPPPPLGPATRPPRTSEDGLARLRAERQQGVAERARAEGRHREPADAARGLEPPPLHREEPSCAAS